VRRRDAKEREEKKQMEGSLSLKSKADAHLQGTAKTMVPHRFLEKSTLKTRWTFCCAATLSATVSSSKRLGLSHARVNAMRL